MVGSQRTGRVRPVRWSDRSRSTPEQFAPPNRRLVGPTGSNFKTMLPSGSSWIKKNININIKSVIDLHVARKKWQPPLHIGLQTNMEHRRGELVGNGSRSRVASGFLQSSHASNWHGHIGWSPNFCGSQKISISRRNQEWLPSFWYSLHLCIGAASWRSNCRSFTVGSHQIPRWALHHFQARFWLRWKTPCCPCHQDEPPVIYIPLQRQMLYYLVHDKCLICSCFFSSFFFFLFHSMIVIMCIGIFNWNILTCFWYIGHWGWAQEYGNSQLQSNTYFQLKWSRCGKAWKSVRIWVSPRPLESVISLLRNLKRSFPLPRFRRRSIRWLRLCHQLNITCISNFSLVFNFFWVDFLWACVRVGFWYFLLPFESFTLLLLWNW